MKPNILADDPRWQRFNDTAYACKCCNQSFNGIFDLVSEAPGPWPGKLTAQPNSHMLPNINILTEDFCVLDEHRYIRVQLPIPIIGAGQDFHFGVWGSLSLPNFELMLDHFNDGTQGELEEVFSCLSNIIPLDGPTNATKAFMRPRNGRFHPLLYILDEEHPYYDAQQKGVSFDQLLDIYAIYGQDIRSHLEQE